MYENAQVIPRTHSDGGMFVIFAALVVWYYQVIHVIHGQSMCLRKVHTEMQKLIEKVLVW